MKNIKYLLVLLCMPIIVFSAPTNASAVQGHTHEKVVDNRDKIKIVDDWKISGDIRAGWVEYGYGNAPLGIDNSGDIIPTNSNTNRGHIDSKGGYIMPKISIMSPKNSRIRAKFTLAGATDFGMNDEKYESRTFVFDPSERTSFILLHEAYVMFKDKEHKALVGREEISTPMIDSDDWYMLANSFQLAYYKNTSLENTAFTLGYFDEMSGVWDSGANGTEFNSMSQASFIDGADKLVIGNAGIYYGAFEYDDEKNHNLQVWNYYADDMYNTLFVQYDYTNNISTFNYDFGIQIMNFKEVGYLATDAASTNIDYSLYQARFDGDFSFGLDFSTGYAKYTDGEGQGATLGAFGGYPYFANGMIFHFFEAGSLENAASYKAQVGYDFAKLGFDNLWIGYRYTYFDLDENYSFNANNEKQNAMILNGVRVSFGDKSGAYFTGTYESVNLDNEPSTYSLRLIGGYKF